MLIKGDVAGDDPVLVRMHAMDPLKDIVGSAGAARANLFRDAMAAIAQEGRGVVVLLRDVHTKLAMGAEVSPHKLRQYGLGAQILSSLGLSKLVLLTNSPRPNIVGLDAYGLEITATRRIEGAT